MYLSNQAQKKNNSAISQHNKLLPAAISLCPEISLILWEQRNLSAAELSLWVSWDTDHSMLIGKGLFLTLVPKNYIQQDSSH